MSRMIDGVVLWATIFVCMGVACGEQVDAGIPREFLQQHCHECHGPDDAAADLRLDQLRSPRDDAQALSTWTLVLDRVENGEMPPADSQRPDAESTRAFLAALRHELAASMPTYGGLRRLNRVEYEHTVHDLLGIDAPLADLLPEDSSVQGFDNVAGGLGLSAILMERYLEAAHVAFDDVVRRIPPSPVSTRRAVLMDLKENRESVEQKKGGVIERHGAFIDFTAGWPPARIDPAHPIEPGDYRCRVAVWPHEPGEHRTLAVGIYVGPLFGPGPRKFIGMYDVTGTPDEPRIIEFTTPMQEAHAIHILPWIYPEHVTWRDKDEPRPGVAIAWAETQGPLDQAFPSKATQKLFGASSSIAMVEGQPIYMRDRKGVKLHYVDSNQPREDAEAIIRRLLLRAFRRPVPEQIARPIVDLTLSRLDAGNSFEEAVRAGVCAVLCSPHFLLVNRQPEVDDYEIAARLSYFLWSSMPDDELLRLASDGCLVDPKVRYAQVERMLGDAKSRRFVENFVGQWLDLREIEFTTPDKNLYPEFDELLLRSMVAETQGFFRYVLDEDLSVLNFVDSDFAILNQRLATHYGVSGVRGHEEFRVVPLPEDSVRGGVLTHASVLKVTANGTNTSPVVRGAWVLEKILGRPSPPPPAGVPAVEPDVRGATTIRQQLEKHRADASCAHCHRRIDPPGFALEEFDVIGGYRTWYRSLGEKGERVAKTRYRIGPTIEQGDQWPDGRRFANFVEFRAQLCEYPDQIANALAKKLVVYATGRPLTPADHGAIDAIVEQSRRNKLGLRSMIHTIVESELFLRP